MAKKIEALEWKSFMSGDVKTKFVVIAPQQPSGKKLIKKVVTMASIIAIESLIIHTIPVFAGNGTSVTTMVMTPDFQTKLTLATAPIRSLINGFAHEIYGVFMAWGAIEVMIGKSQQGFTRIKVATLGYVLLFWIPWIVDTVNGVRPTGV
jgi:hypothetical protein